MLRLLPIALAATVFLIAGPGRAQTPPPPAPPAAAPMPAPLQPGDAFGTVVTLPERTIVFVKGSGTWDKAFDTVAAAFKVLNGYLAKDGIRPAGKAMAIYTKTDDTGFDFQAAVPVDAPPNKPPAEPAGFGFGPAPSGKALKFTHRGSFDALNTTYEAITNHLDEKRLDAQDMFIEEYDGPLSDDPDDPLVVTIFVPIR